MKRTLVSTALATLTETAAYIGASPAVSAALPTSGQCGILTVVPHTFDPDRIAGTTYDLNELAVIDFSTGMINYSLTKLTVESTPPNRRF